MTSKNKTAMILGIIAGILLLISGISGLATWETIKTFVTTHIMDHFIVQIIFSVLIFIASLGGIAVMWGAVLIGKEKVSVGKFFITLGAGLGLIGLIVSLIVVVLSSNFVFNSFFSVGTIGLILSIIARLIAGK